MQKINIKIMQNVDNKVLEEIKKLRTNIEYMYHETKVICITSVEKNEGKSLVSFWLANTFADNAKKVVYIDADLRKMNNNIFEIMDSNEDAITPQIKNFNKNAKIKSLNQSQIVDRLTSKELTLKDYLMGNADVNDIIFESNNNNLYIIASGYEREVPSELLDDKLFEDLISYLRDCFDYIIIDTPAVGEFTDAIIISKSSDGTILVLEPGAVTHKKAHQVSNQFTNIGVKLLGIVMNKL